MRTAAPPTSAPAPAPASAEVVKNPADKNPADQDRVDQMLADLCLPPFATEEDLLPDRVRLARSMAARTPSTPPQVLVELARLAEPHNIAALLSHPATTSEVLALLARLPSGRISPRVCATIAGHPRVTSEVLGLIAANADCGDDALWRLLAEHSRTPAPVLAHLAASEPDERLAAALATNPSLPPECFGLLLRPDRPEVIRLVASNVSTPASLLHLIALKGPDWDKEVSDHPEAEAGTLELLYRRHRSTAMYRAFGSTQDVVCRNLAIHPHTPAWILTELATDVSVVVRTRLALNPSTPHSVLLLLAADTHPDVRRNLAFNPVVDSDSELLLAARFASSGVHVGDPQGLAAAVRAILSASPETRLSA